MSELSWHVRSEGGKSPCRKTCYQSRALLKHCREGCKTARVDMRPCECPGKPHSGTGPSEGRQNGAVALQQEVEQIAPQEVRIKEVGGNKQVSQLSVPKGLVREETPDSEDTQRSEKSQALDLEEQSQIKKPRDNPEKEAHSGRQVPLFVPNIKEQQQQPLQSTTTPVMEISSPAAQHPGQGIADHLPDSHEGLGQTGQRRERALAAHRATHQVCVVMESTG